MIQRAQDVLATTGSDRGYGPRALQDTLRSRCAERMARGGLSYAAAARAIGIDPSTFGKYMRGRQLSLRNLVRIERWLDGEHQHNAHPLHTLADAIAERVLHGDGRIARAHLRALSRNLESIE